MWNSDRMTNWAKDIFSEDHRFSKSYRRGDELPKGKYPPVLLREFYYNENDAEDTYHTTEERLIQAILTFAKDESLNEFRVWGASSSSVVEGKIEQYNPLGKITGQVDLAFQYQGLTKVIDWKLGGEEKGEESLQLSVYGLWATDYYKCKPEDLRVMKIHLSKGHVTFFKVNADVLANATARIIQDMNRMEVMNMYGRRGNQAAFTPCLQASVCRLCSFYEVCYA